MREYIKSRTFWLIFLTAFIAVAGIMLGIFMYVWQNDIKKERQALLDRDFHALLLQATGNPLMTTILDAVSDVYQEWIDIVISRAGADEKAKLHGYHRGIVDGISAGDIESTVRYVDGHYDLIEKLLEI